MGLPEALFLEISKKIISKTTDLLLEHKQDAEAQQANLENHLIEIANWCQRIDFFGRAKPWAINTDTVPLQYGLPRRFKLQTQSDRMGELEIVDDAENYLILGGPGSGKSTTLKRIAYNLLFNADASDDSYHGSKYFQYPLFIILRELKAGQSLIDVLLLKLGLKPTYIERKVAVAEKQDTIIYDKYIGAVPAVTFISKYLNQSQALLLIDGLDEVPNECKASIIDEIQSLARALISSKVICTCRSGDYTRTIEQFSILEICPLEEQDIVNIVEKLSNDPKIFDEDIRQKSYKDILNRPLFLVQLIVIHNLRSYLPDQPSEVMETIVCLLIEEWDKSKNVNRRSKYSHFEKYQKRDFLASLSYQLTHKIRQVTFSTNDLLEAYKKIHDNFRLPENEASQVVQEIESHTGIIVNAGRNTFEFSHFSIQEYLCAHYIVRETSGLFITKYINNFPEPLALAVGMASEPNSLLGLLFLRKSNYQQFGEINYNKFMSRLVYERPFFKANDILGFSIINMALIATEKKFTANSVSYLFDLMKFENVRDSVLSAMTYYLIIKEDLTVSLKLNYPVSMAEGFAPIDNGKIDIEIFKTLTDDKMPVIDVAKQAS